MSILEELSPNIKNEIEESLNKIRKTHYGYGVTDTLKKIEKMLGEDVSKCDCCEDYELASLLVCKNSGDYCDTCAERFHN